MKRYGITKWNTTLYDQNNRLIYQETWQPNLLHYEGEQYVLSAAFHTILKGFGMAPPLLYIGVDNRDKIFPKDTLATVVKAEIKKIIRAPVSTGDGFVPTWEKPSLTEREIVEGKQVDPVFVLNSNATFIAKEDLGQIKNYFLTTASEGSGGVLIVSSTLRKPFDMDKGYQLTVGMAVSLRDAKLED